MRRPRVVVQRSLDARLFVALAFTAAALLSVPAEADAKSWEEKVRHFEQHIRPVLMTNCLECHSRQKAENGFRVDTRQNLVSGGRGGRTIEQGNPDASRLIQALRYEHEDLQMPPDGKLDDRVIEAFEQWVADGAAWPEELNLPQDRISLEEGRKHWAYRPLENPEVPDVEGAATPIDAFILAKLNEADMQPVEKADRRTLIRRATYDLTGLPPTPEEVEAFVNDDREDAYARLIDRLLASPEYGRRWGRHWMDVARYADTSGDGVDRPVPEAQLYRDYIIDAFNNDMPFDDFVIEQIAGDILAKKTGERYEERLIATSYIALSRRQGNGKFADMHLVIENTIDTIGRGLLAQTLSCARCHDHKFDPIPEDDYYALYGFFESTQYPHPGSEHGREREFLVPYEQEQIQKLAEWEATIDERREAVHQEYADHALAAEAEELQAELAAVRSELEAMPDRKEKLQAEIERLEAAVAEKREAHEKLVAEAISELEAERPREPDVVYGVEDKADKDEIGDVHVQVGGNRWKKGALAPRGFLSVITPEKPEIPEGESGRLQLAEWLVSDENPLTPRVMANRIWHWHFGRGIVPSTDNFGVQGQKPTHPELLEYLANQLVESGWSFKEMHRQIMLSDAYQRSSRAESTNLAADPANDKLWRFERRRLEAEAIRDAVLMVSGRLDRSRAENHPFGNIEDHKRFTQHNPFLADFDKYEHNHRSVYLMTQRLQRHPMIGLFDGPNRNVATGRRNVSTVALQSLFMMNSAFVRENARALADRLLAIDAPDRERMNRAFELAFSRSATEEELDDSLAFIEHAEQSLGDLSEEDRRQHAWTGFARVLLSSSEFIYID